MFMLVVTKTPNKIMSLGFYENVLWLFCHASHLQYDNVEYLLSEVEERQPGLSLLSPTTATSNQITPSTTASFFWRDIRPSSHVRVRNVYCSGSYQWQSLIRTQHVVSIL